MVNKSFFFLFETRHRKLPINLITNSIFFFLPFFALKNLWISRLENIELELWLTPMNFKPLYRFKKSEKDKNDLFLSFSIWSGIWMFVLERKTTNLNKICRKWRRCNTSDSIIHFDWFTIGTCGNSISCLL